MMNEVTLLIVGVLAGVVLSWYGASRRASKRLRAELSSLVESLRSGNLPDPGRLPSSSIPELRDLRMILAREWTPRAPGEEELARRAFARILEYLRRRVRSPLLEAMEGSDQTLRRTADDALAAVEDLEFFLEEAPASEGVDTLNLGDLVQEVTREFARQSDLLIKVRSPQTPVRVRVDGERLKDAIFLILHNAGEYGGDGPVDLTLIEEGHRASLKIADQGPGFSADALLRAMDPFYTTSEEGLGLGLPHARQAVNDQGGEILLRNRDSGGAEVEIRLPLAE